LTIFDFRFLISAMPTFSPREANQKSKIKALLAVRYKSQAPLS